MKCSICNNEFEPVNSLQKYCSHNCRDKNKQIKNSEKRSKQRKEAFEAIGDEKKCLICNKDFKVTQQHRKKKYCSYVCRRKAERVFGDKKQTDLDYKNNIRFGGNKYKVMERDGYECQMCGNETQLVVHHIDGSGQSDSANNEMDNLTTLCRRCHINLHKLLDI